MKATSQPCMRMTPPRYGDGEPIPKDTIREAMPGAAPAEVDRVFQWIAALRSAEIYNDDLKAGRLKAAAAERRRVARQVEERRMGLQRATILARREARRVQRRVLVAPQPARDAGSNRSREHRSPAHAHRGPPDDDPHDDDPPGPEPHTQAEVELLRREWASLSGVQRVQRVAMLELHTGVEWTTLGDIFTRRGAIIEWREEAA